MVSDIGHRDLLLNYYKLNDIQTREIGDSNSVCLQTSLNNELNSNTFPITCANYRNNIEFSSSKKSEKRDDIIAHGIHIDTSELSYFWILKVYVVNGIYHFISCCMSYNHVLFFKSCYIMLTYVMLCYNILSNHITLPYCIVILSCYIMLSC